MNSSRWLASVPARDKPSNKDHVYVVGYGYRCVCVVPFFHQRGLFASFRILSSLCSTQWTFFACSILCASSHWKVLLGQSRVHFHDFKHTHRDAVPRCVRDVVGQQETDPATYRQRSGTICGSKRWLRLNWDGLHQLGNLCMCVCMCFFFTSLCCRCVICSFPVSHCGHSTRRRFGMLHPEYSFEFCCMNLLSSPLPLLPEWPAVAWLGIQSSILEGIEEYKNRQNEHITRSHSGGGSPTKNIKDKPFPSKWGRLRSGTTIECNMHKARPRFGKRTPDAQKRAEKDTRTHTYTAIQNKKWTFHARRQRCRSFPTASHADILANSWQKYWHKSWTRSAVPPSVLLAYAGCQAELTCFTP